MSNIMFCWYLAPLRYFLKAALHLLSTFLRVYPFFQYVILIWNTVRQKKMTIIEFFVQILLILCFLCSFSGPIHWHSPPTKQYPMPNYRQPSFATNISYPAYRKAAAPCSRQNDVNKARLCPHSHHHHNELARLLIHWKILTRTYPGSQGSHRTHFYIELRGCYSPSRLLCNLRGIMLWEIKARSRGLSTCQSGLCLFGKQAII